MVYPPPYIINPESGNAHTNTIILLHGRGSTARTFAQDLLLLKTSSPSQNLLAHFPNARWVFPDAGERWCTPFKEKASAWCDTFSLEDLSVRQDLQVAGLRDGILHVRCIVEEEIERLGGKSEKVILGGFSQGSATALWSLFTGAAVARGPLGGFFGIGAWMPFTREAKKAVGISEVALAQEKRVPQLATTFWDILGIDPVTPVEMIQARLHKMPVSLGHGTDVCISPITKAKQEMLLITVPCDRTFVSA
ncbi:hypothetical protein K504DRAFT_464629 [Pleomassaria siparia CBS 279.74]|uniref:Phospholipase/carboxylesterase/thioesterase domain-containing protein n=1 Tax=Pleomassaria siparia CBS 279.74 TaxID=1314801 RepID=A0A6G1KI69_9PLEO|nr:hypothetical protein K504DRAFT_464629 [Pleomassaria siparia CBS 279.74]